MAIGGGGGENLESHNLRDFLRIKDDDCYSNLNQSTSSNGGGGTSRHKPSGLTLNDILREKRALAPIRPADETPLQRIQSNRTLLDIIRDDQTSGLGGGRRSWRQLREKIRIRSIRDGGSAWSSTVPVPDSDVPINNNNNYNNRTMMTTTTTTRRPSTRFNSNVDSSESTQPDPSLHRANGRFQHNNSLARRRLISEDNFRGRDDEEDEEEERSVVIEDEDGAAEQQPVRMSLMALLALNDRQMGLEGSAYVMDGFGKEVAEEKIAADVAGGIAGGEYNSCCVCMVRHKGAAFIPCGHTFCRLCSRELWVQRGNCPLCNNYISEILDIF